MTGEATLDETHQRASRIGGQSNLDDIRLLVLNAQLGDPMAAAP